MKEKEELRLNELKKMEQGYFDKGIEYLCGIDEAGRGPLAGPVAVAAVIMPRELLYDQIIAEAISYSIALIDEKEIDRINILNATKVGVTTAIQGLSVKPDRILVDALTGIDTCGVPYDSIIKGDAKCYSIAAASILAKVTRDRIMRQMDERYPVYGFEKHKGYGTAAHIQAIREHGLCPIHRRSFTKNIVR